MSISDKTLLSNDPYLSKLVSTDLEKALANGYDGWIDDDLAFVNPLGWGQHSNYPDGYWKQDVFTSEYPITINVELIRFADTIFGVTHQNYYVDGKTRYGIAMNNEYVFNNILNDVILNNVGPLSVALKLPSKLSELNNSDINNKDLSNRLMDLVKN